MKVSDEEALQLEAEERRRLIEFFYRTESVAFLRAAVSLRKADATPDKADWVIFGHGTAPVGRPSDNDHDLLLAMARKSLEAPELLDDPYKLARLTEENCGGPPSRCGGSRAGHLAKKWQTLPSQDAKGVQAGWWAERIRAVLRRASAVKITRGN